MSDPADVDAQTKVGAGTDLQPEIVGDAMNVMQPAAGHESPGIGDIAAEPGQLGVKPGIDVDTLCNFF